MQIIIGWAAALDASWLQGELTWFSGAAGREVTKPKWLLVTHMFNHQTHHRGQVHCMLTQCGGEAGCHGFAVPAGGVIRGDISLWPEMLSMQWQPGARDLDGT